MVILMGDFSSSHLCEARHYGRNPGWAMLRTKMADLYGINSDVIVLDEQMRQPKDPHFNPKYL